MENFKDMTLVGYYHFETKDKSKVYYILQCLVSKVDNDNCKGSLVNVFVNENTYRRVVNDFDIGSTLKVEVIPNYDTGKVSYRLSI